MATALAGPCLALELAGASETGAFAHGAGSRTGHGAPISYFNNKAFLLNFNRIASGDAHHDRKRSGRNGA
jgi:hypothetical protein